MPGKYYIYIPFASTDKGGNKDLVEAAGSWQTERRKHNGLQDPQTKDERENLKRKVPTLLVRGEKPSVLAQLASEDPTRYTLYIMAHCNAGRNTVFNIQGVYDPDRTTLTEVQLVQRLVEDGIPFNVMNLKLFACLGGQPSETEAAFGEKLYKELLSRGFYCVKLTAYKEALKAATVDAVTGHKRTQSGRRPSSVKQTWGPPTLTLTPLGEAVLKKHRAEHPQGI
jgi:hypothetical protein